MHRLRRVLLTTVVLVVGLPSLGLTGTPAMRTPLPDMSGALPFEGTRWILRSYRAEDGSTALPVAEASITFDAAPPAAPGATASARRATPSTASH